MEYLAHREFVKCKSTTLFATNDPITRADFITILARMSEEDLPIYEGPFSDVKADVYYAGAVAWEIEAGIIKGTSDTAFSPNRSISRQEIATLLGRYLIPKNENIFHHCTGLFAVRRRGKTLKGNKHSCGFPAPPDDKNPRRINRKCFRSRV